MVKNAIRTERYNMIKRTTFIGILALIVLSGCTNLTEHEMASKAGLHIISSEDFSTQGTITDMAGARCLLVYPGNFFVVSTEGTVTRYDSENMELIEEYLVGAPSPAGYSQIVYSNLKNSAYLIGAQGKILEISMPSCVVDDEFTVCQSPVKLALGPGSEYLFVSDGPSTRVHQVSTDGNQTYDNVLIYFAINCMSPFQDPDSLLVGTSVGMTLVEIMSSTDIRGTRLNVPGAFFDLAAIPDERLFVGVRGSDVGVFSISNLIAVPPLNCFYGVVELEEGSDNHQIVIGQDLQHAYILSYLSDRGISRLVAYNYRFHSITQEMDIPGYPLDLQISGNGDIYVLTAE